MQVRGAEGEEERGQLVHLLDHVQQLGEARAPELPGAPQLGAVEHDLLGEPGLLAHQLLQLPHRLTLQLLVPPHEHAAAPQGVLPHHGVEGEEPEAGVVGEAAVLVQQQVAVVVASLQVVGPGVVVVRQARGEEGGECHGYVPGRVELVDGRAAHGGPVEPSTYLLVLLLRLDHGHPRKVHGVHGLVQVLVDICGGLWRRAVLGGVPGPRLAAGLVLVCLLHRLVVAPHGQEHIVVLGQLG